MILVIIYILTIFFGKDYFSISQLGIFFTLLGLGWSLVVFIQTSIRRKSLFSFSFLKLIFQPLILIIIGNIAIEQDSLLVLKSFPLTLSALFVLAFIYAQITQDFFLINYIKKFKELDEKEENYLKKTHIIWIGVTGINVALHAYFLFYRSTAEWTFYTTIGWYILLACGILFQILFRRFYERQNTN